MKRILVILLVTMLSVTSVQAAQKEKLKIYPGQEVKIEGSCVPTATEVFSAYNSQEGNTIVKGFTRGKGSIAIEDKEYKIIVKDIPNIYIRRIGQFGKDTLYKLYNKSDFQVTPEGNKVSMASVATPGGIAYFSAREDKYTITIANYVSQPGPKVELVQEFNYYGDMLAYLRFPRLDVLYGGYLVGYDTEGMPITYEKISSSGLRKTTTYQKDGVLFWKFYEVLNVVLEEDYGEY